MAQRHENDRSDFVSKIIYFGEDKITRDEFQKEIESFKKD